MRKPQDEPLIDLAPEVGLQSGLLIVTSRERHEALAAIEREVDALLGQRRRNLPTLIAKLRSLL